MKIIILDRDGVINQDSETYIKTPDEWLPLPGSLEAIARLTQAGYHVLVATNQSGVGRGLLDIEVLNNIHNKMHRLTYEVGGFIEAIFFCTATDDDHPDRKPNPGLLEDIGRRLKVNLKGVPVVGDSLRDLQAAQAVGAQPLLVRTGKGAHTLTLVAANDYPVFDDLAAVADYLLASAD